MKIRSITNYISYPLQIAYKLIEEGRSKDILKVQGLSIDGLNDNEDTIITLPEIKYRVRIYERE